MTTAVKATVAALGTAAVALISSPLAHATVYTGSVAPTNITPVAATNVRSMNVSIDNEAGTWQTIVTFRGWPTKTTLARTYRS